MAQQPVSGGQWTSIGTIGTVAITDRPATLVRVILPGTYIGTVNFHDAYLTSGTTATSQVFSLGIPRF